MQFRLGRKAVKTDSRTLRLARYLTAELPSAPPSVDWTKKAYQAWGCMENDRLGCCTISGCGHAIQVWTANASQETTIPDSAIEAAYSAWDGYVHGDPNTDNGGVELDVLNNWRKNGLAGHSLLAYADANVLNIDEVRQAINLFGGVYIGVDLPLSAQNQDVWDVIPDDGTDNYIKGSWGGHCVFVPKYDADSFTCITWGETKKMTAWFWKAYVDECHVLLSPDFIAANGSPNGFNLDQLTADLAQIH
jgi:hypothetical protein